MSIKTSYQIRRIKNIAKPAPCWAGFSLLHETTSRQKGVPYLDVSATYKNDEVMICVVNRNKDEVTTTDFIRRMFISGNFEVYEVKSPDIKISK